MENPENILDIMGTKLNLDSLNELDLDQLQEIQKKLDNLIRKVDTLRLDKEGN